MFPDRRPAAAICCSHNLPHGEPWGYVGSSAAIRRLHGKSPRLFYTSNGCGGSESASPLGGLSVCYGQEEHVLFALLDEDILAVEKHIFGGHGVGRGYLLLVD